MIWHGGGGGGGNMAGKTTNGPETNWTGGEGGLAGVGL